MSGEVAIKLEALIFASIRDWIGGFMKPAVLKFFLVSILLASGGCSVYDGLMNTAGSSPAGEDVRQDAVGPGDTVDPADSTEPADAAQPDTQAPDGESPNGSDVLEDIDDSDSHTEPDGHSDPCQELYPSPIAPDIHFLVDNSLGSSNSEFDPLDPVKKGILESLEDYRAQDLNLGLMSFPRDEDPGDPSCDIGGTVKLDISAFDVQFLESALEEILNQFSAFGMHSRLGPALRQLDRAQLKPRRDNVNDPFRQVRTVALIILTNALYYGDACNQPSHLLDATHMLNSLFEEHGVRSYIIRVGASGFDGANTFSELTARGTTLMNSESPARTSDKVEEHLKSAYEKILGCTFALGSASLPPAAVLQVSIGGIATDTDYTVQDGTLVLTQDDCDAMKAQRGPEQLKVEICQGAN